MKKLNKNELGFGAVEIFIIILIVVAIGGVGFYVWHSRNNNSSSTSTTSTTTTTQTKTTTSTVKISELGIEFTVPETLKDLSFRVINMDYNSPGNNTLGTYPTAYLSTKSLNAAENGECDISTASVTKGTVPPLGFLTKTTGQYPSAPTADNSTGTLVKQFSTYYIAYRSAGMSCFSEKANVDKTTALNSQLATALKTITETK